MASDKEQLPQGESGINLQDDEEETGGQTSDLNLDNEDNDEDETADAGTDDTDGDYDDKEDDDDEDEGGEDGTKKTETKPGAPDWESDENPYKKRHADSVREVNEVLLPKTKEVDKLITERDELLAKLKAEKPEVYDNVTLQKQLKENTEKLALLSEKSQLDDFIADNPDAKPFREKLKAHARAFPQDSLEKIWKETFEPLAKAQASTKEQRKQQKRQNAGERQRGGATADHDGETIGGLTLEQFNKLSSAQQKEHLIKSGIKM